MQGKIKMLYSFIAVKTLSFTKNIALVSEVKSYRVFTGCSH